MKNKKREMKEMERTAIKYSNQIIFIAGGANTKLL